MTCAVILKVSILTVVILTVAFLKVVIYSDDERICYSDNVPFCKF